MFPYCSDCCVPSSENDQSRTGLTLLISSLLYTKKTHCQDQVIFCVFREYLVIHDTMGSGLFRLDFIKVM
jgi:hypothetical protein